jgi:hypothetical protein
LQQFDPAAVVPRRPDVALAVDATHQSPGGSRRRSHRSHVEELPEAAIAAPTYPETSRLERATTLVTQCYKAPLDAPARMLGQVSHGEPTEADEVDGAERVRREPSESDGNRREPSESDES